MKNIKDVLNKRKWKDTYLEGIKTNKEYFILGLKGPKTVGKSTYAAEIQNENDYFVLALAKPIKDIVHSTIETLDLADAFKIYKKYLDEEHQTEMNNLLVKLIVGVKDGRYTLEEKESIRYFYQKVGDIMRDYDINIYIKIFLDNAYAQDKKFILCDDIRQFNEAFMCDKLVNLSRDGVEYTNEHVSEMDYTENEWKIVKKHVDVENYEIKFDEKYQ